MSDWTIAEPMGSILFELRAANIASKRVRASEPGPNDAKGEGEYQRFVVVVDLGGVREHRVPLQTRRYALRAYGVTPQDAADLYMECSDVLDNGGPRYGPTNVAIYQSLDDTGGSSSLDPITKQPVYEGVFEIFAGAQALAS
jgi:hypothetical protein